MTGNLGVGITLHEDQLLRQLLSRSAMKARCLGAPGCNAFNTNGDLYQGTGVKPFRQYSLHAVLPTLARVRS